MVTQTDRFITQLKLRELREQRLRFLGAYDQLTARLSEQSTESERLRLLYDGLRAIQFAAQPLHPEVANLEPLFLEMTTARPSVETVSFWRARLERELGQGRLRAELIYIFGALLEEWASQPTPDAAHDDQRAALIALMAANAPAPLATDALDSLFAHFAYAPEQARAEMRSLTDGFLLRRVEPKELEPVLEQISADPHSLASTRAQARAFQHDDLLKKELADTLTIMLNRLDEWDWPSEGVSSRATLTPNKWRLFLDEDLPTACFLEILGGRWMGVIQSFLKDEQAARLRQLRQTARAGGPIMAAEPLHLTAGLDMIGETTIWEPAETSNNSANGLERDLASWMEDATAGWGVFSQRRSMRAKLRDLRELSTYSSARNRGGMETAITLLNADIQISRAAYPDRPLHILKVDLQDFYPTLPHALVIELLTRYGLSERQLAFFQRYLALPLQDGATLSRARRGAPNEHALSHLLGELILSALDWYVEQRAQVQIVRLVDDIAIMASSTAEAVKAWEAIQTFCATFGLTVNRDKCGAVSIGGERPTTLPQGQPTWSLLALDDQGHWNVAVDAFAAYLEQARQQALQQQSALAQIQTYNEHLTYLVKALGVQLPLDSAHREQANQALLRFQQEFFGADQGLIPTLQAQIRGRFLEPNSTTTLPEAWLYWPITAGGCGLLNGALLAASYARAYTQRVPNTLPEERQANWQTGQRDWNQFYMRLLGAVKPSAPEPNQVMEGLVKDFIERGSELSSGKQKDLSPYWRWTLYIYGPQVLDALGTFRYLISELVPLQLTTRKQGQSESEISDEEEDIPF